MTIAREPLTYERMTQIVRAASGRQYATKNGRRFLVSTEGDLPVFTPTSTGFSRHPQRPEIQAFVDRYNATSSLMPKDYQDVTRNSSYFIALLRENRGSRSHRA